MLEGIRKNIEKLISLCESAKAENERLREALQQSRVREDSQRKQIDELKRQVENLELKGAFVSAGGDNTVAAKKIEGLIRDIDRCLSVLE